MKITRRQTVAGMAALAGLGLSPVLAGENIHLRGRAFGTSWSVIAPALRRPEALSRRIAALLLGLDREMSPFRTGSDLSRFNREGSILDLSPDFAHVAAAALDMAQASGGAFDPTVGPFVNRLGFGPIRGRTGSWRQISLSGERLARDGAVTLDLCGIAKGHAVDRMAALLREHTDRFLVEVGGEIRAAGAWPVGIADPLRGAVHSRIRLEDLALATSGDAINGYAIGNKRISHTIDPTTGESVNGEIASVSVLARTAMEADALATALLVMGEVRGLAFAESRGAAAFFLLRQGDGLRASASPAFAARLIREG